ncbi:stealth family protein [Phycicoccus jejuensis]|uniref:stealth family protein n=1 Tax=Phycicoccus jejuensis TaxID=367299 RepID=UPI0038511893
MRLARAVPVPAREWVRAHVPDPVWRQIRDVANGRTLPQRAVRDLRETSAKARVAQHRRGWSAVTVAGQVYVAKQVESFRAGDVLDANLAVVADALEAADVPYFVLDAEPGTRRVVVVRQPNRAQALRALAAACRGDVVYVGRVGGQQVRGVRVVRPQTLPRRAKVVRVFRAYASPDGRFIGGPALGCDLEFWPVASSDRPAAENGEPIPAGTLVAPRVNRWIDLITPDEQETTPRRIGDTERPTLASVRYPHVQSVQFPVDVVYTWVDGSDPAWLERKARTLEARGGDAGELHALATNPSRFVSRDELRFSMRSLDMYADWVRHVYLVTDDQVPEWLDTDNPRVTVVSHRELFGDRGRLPTFNSHAIETQLHHIEGLSEQYLYLNDDVFFARPVSPTHFFVANGLSTFHMSKAKIGLGHPSAEDAPVMSAAKRNRDLLAGAYGVTIANKFWHVPHALRRSTMTDLEQRFADEFRATSCAQFRSPMDLSVAASLGHYYGYLTGRAVPGRLRYFYADIAKDDTPARLTGLLDERNFDVFCLNDHDSSGMDPAAQAKIVRNFLQAYFPLKSSFERD